MDKRIAVIGAGAIGGYTGGQLAHNGFDVTLIDPDLEWTVRTDQFQSLSRNSPFDGWKLKGRAVRTMVAGKTVWKL